MNTTHTDKAIEQALPQSQDGERELVAAAARWKSEAYSRHGWHRIRDVDGEVIATHMHPGHAAHVVRCANAYPRLVAALKDTYNREPLHCTKAGMLLRELGEIK